MAPQSGGPRSQSTPAEEPVQWSCFESLWLRGRRSAGRNAAPAPWPPATCPQSSRSGSCNALQRVNTRSSAISLPSPAPVISSWQPETDHRLPCMMDVSVSEACVGGFVWKCAFVCVPERQTEERERERDVDPHWHHNKTFITGFDWPLCCGNTQPWPLWYCAWFFNSQHRFTLITQHSTRDFQELSDNYKNYQSRLTEEGFPLWALISLYVWQFFVAADFVKLIWKSQFSQFRLTFIIWTDILILIIWIS